MTTMAQIIQHTFLLLSTVVLFLSPTHQRVCAFTISFDNDHSRHRVTSSKSKYKNKNYLVRKVRSTDEDDITVKNGNEDDVDDTKRRQTFKDIILSVAATTTTTSALASCCVGTVGTFYHPQAAYGLAKIVAPDSATAALFDVSRNQIMDAAFAQGMATGMGDYELEASVKKKELFADFFSSIKNNGNPEPAVVEIGMGSFPNAIYYNKNQMKNLDIIGIDPNDKMEGYAQDNAKKAKLLGSNNLRIIHGVSEALPLATSSVDAVVCTLTLCSVVDPVKSVSEIKRVLKPGGKFLFWEHVLSETDETLKKEQIAYTPRQVKRADGCHLDRQTGKIIKEAGFKSLDLEYLELKNFYYLNPTSCGIATA